MLSPGKELFKKLARTLLGDYSAYYIYASPNGGNTLPPSESKPNASVRAVDETTIHSSADPLIREQAHMLEMLHGRRFHAAQGLSTGNFRPFVEEEPQAGSTSPSSAWTTP